MRSISFEKRIKPILSNIRGMLYVMEMCRKEKWFETADTIRKELLNIDSGMRITIERSGKISLWHWPNPPFTDQFHICNYGEFIANSREFK